MSRNERILVLGAGPFQVPMIEITKKHNLMTYAVSNVSHDPGLKIADKAFNISILDYPGLENLCQREQITAVVSCASDLATFAYSHLNEKFGYKGLLPEQVRAVSDKAKFFDLQKILNLNWVPTFEVSTKSDLPGIFSQIKEYPVIMKPVISSGSRGIYLANNEKDILNNYQMVSEASFLRKGCIVQEFIQGTEIGAECLIENGNVAFLEFTHKYLNRYYVPMGHCVPNPIDQPIKASIKGQIEKIVRHLQIKNTPINLDTMVLPDGKAIIIDFSFRLGGNLLPDIMDAKYNIDPYVRTISYALHESDLHRRPLKTKPGVWGSVIFGAEKPGRLSQEMVDKIKSLFTKQTNLKELLFDIQPGEQIEIFMQGNKKFGHALAEFHSSESYAGILKEVSQIFEN